MLWKSLNMRHSTKLEYDYIQYITSYVRAASYIKKVYNTHLINALRVYALVYKGGQFANLLRGNEPYRQRCILLPYIRSLLTSLFFSPRLLFYIFCSVQDACTWVRPTFSRIRLIKILAPRLTSCLTAMSLVTHSTE